MANGYVGPGHNVTVTVPSGGCTEGVGLLIGNLFGVALETALEGASAEIATEGHFTIAKTSALAISAGDLLYWDNTNKVVNKTSSSQKPVGLALTAAANPSSTVEIKLTPNITAAA